jgi:hypothetical protein
MPRQPSRRGSPDRTVAQACVPRQSWPLQSKTRRASPGLVEPPAGELTSGGTDMRHRHDGHVPRSSGTARCGWCHRQRTMSLRKPPSRRDATTGGSNPEAGETPSRLAATRAAQVQTSVSATRPDSWPPQSLTPVLEPAANRAPTKPDQQHCIRCGRQLRC